MWYEINVSLYGIHFFATDRRSIITEKHASHVYQTLKAKFPESEGYDISLYRKNETGHEFSEDAVEEIVNRYPIEEDPAFGMTRDEKKSKSKKRKS